MKIRATKASPGAIKIKVNGVVSKWIQPIGLDGKPGKWVDIPDGNEEVDRKVALYRNGGQIEVEGFVKMRPSIITQCAGSPNCTEPIANKDVNMCHHHTMKLYNAADKAKEDDAIAIAESKIEKAEIAAEKETEKVKSSAKTANNRTKKSEEKKTQKKK